MLKAEQVCSHYQQCEAVRDVCAHYQQCEAVRDVSGVELRLDILTALGR